MSQTQIKNECRFCSKSFTRKSYYDRHMLICELFSKSKKERNVEVEEDKDTPTVRKLYKIIMEMSIKYNKMEEKVEELSKYVDTKKKKINIIEWLNTTYISCELFDEWMKKIKVERKHIETIFNHDYVHGALHVFKDHMSYENVPIRSYDQKDNIFYIFTNANIWCEMTQQQFDKMIDFISKQFIHEFVLWQNENKHRMEDDNYAMTYMKNIRKMNGGNNTTTEQLYRKIHRELYKNTKTSLKVNQYDVVIV